MAKKVKTNALSIAVPQSREECNDFIARIGEHQRERDRIEADMNDEIAPIKLKYEAQALPHAQAITELTHGVHAWCEAHREELTDGNKVKFAKLAAGEVNWRFTPFSVKITKADEVIARLKSLGLTQYVRTKEEVNKEAILASEDTRAQAAMVAGISITRREEFAIVPFSTELEEVAA